MGQGQARIYRVAEVNGAVSVISVCDFMGGRTNQGWETHRVNIETVGVYCVCDFMGGRTNQGWETHG